MTNEEALIAVLKHRRAQSESTFIEEVAQLLLMTRAQQKNILRPRVQAFRDAMETAAEVSTAQQDEIDGVDSVLTLLT